MQNKPLYIVFDDGVTARQRDAVIAAVSEVRQVAKQEEVLSVKDFGVWRQPGYDQDDVLQQWQSIDWYLAYARHLGDRVDQIHGGKLLKLMYNEPWQKSHPHYDLAVISEDMYDDETNFVLGLAVPGFGTVLSTHRLRGLHEQVALECIKTEVMHELAHVFGVPSDQRTIDVEESLGKHCTNRCVMRQGLEVPKDWVRITQDRLVSGQPFCNRCIDDLHSFFEG